MASSGNFCTMNPVAQIGGSDSTQKIFEKGNLQVRNFSYFDASVIGNFGVTSGKWYYEATFETGNSGSGPAWGWCNSRFNIDAGLSYNVPSSDTGGDTIHIYGVGDSGTVRVTSGVHNESNSNWANTSATGSSGQICGIAVDFDNSKAYFSINGSFTDVRSGQDPANGTNPCLAPSGGLYTWNLTADNMKQYGPWYPAIGNWAASSRTVRVNFGQDSTFSGQVAAGGFQDENGFGDFKYSVPAGFLAICSGNIPVSADIDPAGDDGETENPTKQFNVLTYTGNGGTRTLTGLGFQPDLVWIKSRSNANSNELYDSSRGATKRLRSDTNDAEDTRSSELTGFTSDGFSLGASTYGGTNYNSYTYVAWCWRMNGGTTATNNDGNVTTTVQANQAAGQSIVQWTGNATNSTTLGHGLTKKPNFVIVKRRENSQSWNTWGQFNNNGSATGEYGYLFLETTGAYSNGSGALKYWYPAGMTTSTIGVGGASGNNNSGEAMLMYCFHDVEGYSKFGYYEGNGSSDGPFIYTGFRPKLLVQKRTDGTGSWRVWDSARHTHNPNDAILRWEDSGAEDTANATVDFLSNGFKIRITYTDVNADGGKYIYLCWGDVSFKYNNTF